MISYNFGVKDWRLIITSEIIILSLLKILCDYFGDPSMAIVFWCYSAYIVYFQNFLNNNSGKGYEEIINDMITNSSNLDIVLQMVVFAPVYEELLLSFIYNYNSLFRAVCFTLAHVGALSDFWSKTMIFKYVFVFTMRYFVYRDNLMVNILIHAIQNTIACSLILYGKLLRTQFLQAQSLQAQSLQDQSLQTQFWQDQSLQTQSLQTQSLQDQSLQTQSLQTQSL